MIFDGVDQTDLFLGKGSSKRDSFIYFEDLDFGGIRVGNYKTIYTQRDTWLGYKKDKNIPALYNLQWDPQEQHDIFFSPDSGDRMWRVIYNNNKVVDTFLKETSDIPNRPPAGAGDYITKNSVELIMKKGMIEEAIKNLTKQKPRDSSKETQK